MAKGLIRNIDELGRVTIPIDYRQQLDIKGLDRTDITIDNAIIRLSKGHGRKLDKLGRYTIPMELRKSFGWSIGQAMDIYVEDNQICIRKNGCEWCDNTEDLIKVKGHHICKACAAEVKSIA